MPLTTMNDSVFSTIQSINQNFLLPLILLILFIIIFISVALYRYFKLKRKVHQVDHALRILEKNDPIWRKEHLITFIEFFMKEVMGAWSAKDRGKLGTLLSGNLYEIREKMLEKLDEVGQFNVIDDIQLDEIILVDVKDFTDDELDRFTARIRYDAVNFTKNYRDKWEAPRWGKDVDPNPDMESKEYIEFWTFLRHGKSWKLAKLEKEWKEGDYTDSEPVLKDEKYMAVEDI